MTSTAGESPEPPPPIAPPAAPVPPDPEPSSQAAEAPPSALPVAAPPEPQPAAEPALPPPVLAPVAEVHRFQFHGRTAEYFRIWIVNTLLTLLTAGIFFAWAKVRKRRYLRGCTELMGHRFDYRADPRRLLIGHLVVFALFAAYSLFGTVYPPVRYGTLIVGVIFLPWIVVRSLTFNAHNTLYRGLRFRFNPSLSPAALLYLGESLLIIASLGVYYPGWIRSQRRYLITNHRLGDAYFHFEGATWPFYRTYLLASGVVFIAAAVGTAALTYSVAKGQGAPPSFTTMIPFFVVYGIGFFIGRHLVHAHLFNHLWNHTRLDDHRFRADMSVSRWLGLQLTNLGAILVSAGLLYPWAVIRSQRYAASCLALVPAGSIEGIQRVGGGAGSATGDSAAEFIGLDFGL